MVKHLLIFASLFCVVFSGQGQNTNHKYKDVIFKNVTIDKDLAYISNIPPDEKESYLFDLYQPKGDHSTSRPLIIWMHGGGFKFGSKDDKSIEIWSKNFAQRGYVCAAINYRLSKKSPILHFGELQKDSYYAVQDARLAIEYFRKNHTEYNIDPNKIILAGNSAGGIIALQTVYSTNTELAQKLGIIDSDSIGKPNEKVQIAGIINFWGAIYDINWLNNAHVPIVSVHGRNDNIVPPDHKNLSLYGSIAIHQKADALHIPNGLKLFDGYSHELQKHFNPFFSGGKSTQGRWLVAAQFAADFLYGALFK